MKRWLLGIALVVHELCTRFQLWRRIARPRAVDVQGPTADLTGLARRPMLAADDAERLADTFSLLGSSTRVRLLHALARSGEVCVKDLAAEIGMSSSAVCNQLQRLVDRRILAARRNGNFVYYRVEDPCLVGLIEAALCMTLFGPGDHCPQ